MPLDRASSKFVICPPKNGTHTIQHIMPQDLNGHMRFAEAHRQLDGLGIDPDTITFAMIVRHPVNRYVSAINHNMRVRNWGLDEAVEASISSDEIVFYPQMWFWQDDAGILLFPFDGMPIIDWLGWQGKRPHKNLGHEMVTRREITDHKLFQTAMARYNPDWVLYEATNFG